MLPNIGFLYCNDSNRVRTVTLFKLGLSHLEESKCNVKGFNESELKSLFPFASQESYLFCFFEVSHTLKSGHLVVIQQLLVILFFYEKILLRNYSVIVRPVYLVKPI